MFRTIFIVLFSLFSSSPILAENTNTALSDQPLQPQSIHAALLTEVTAKGQKIAAVALEYEDNLLSGDELQDLYQIDVFLDDTPLGKRQILKAYSMDSAVLSSLPKSGKYIVLELNKQDENADLYSLKTENNEPMSFRARNEENALITREIVQSNRVPEYYKVRLQYVIQQKGMIKLSNGKTIAPNKIHISAEPNNLKNSIIDQFQANQVHLTNPQNTLHYQLYKPQQSAVRKQYPLTIFLHGSGQLGTDNIAQLLSSKGAISTLKYEDGFVLAPQYASVFDPFDDTTKGQQGGVHWQTENRRKLLLAMIDKTIQENPEIDTSRIYIVGLSRGAEGGLYLLLDRPDFFAAALLMSGREAYTIEWLDGNATKENLAPVNKTPIWFFHSKEDKVSPVAGSRINYQIIAEQLKNPYVKYTEFSFNQLGDNGILNNNPHNTWDAVFNSPEAISWLLRQKR
ncbi:phospholipase [Chelonobacter oris]|uniref:alpha/beta hydrolase-fold protein n=1 Tax=Chelonobacter oris TaxID=505317 RepID=UPI002A261F37|nr:phospholipase [Chelonobacter oris]